MKRFLVILLGCATVFIVVAGLILILIESLTFKKCPSWGAPMASFTRCSTSYQSPFLQGVLFSLKIKEIESDANISTLTLDYPLFGILHQSMKFYVGSAPGKNPDSRPQISICRTPSACEKIEARNLKSKLKVGQQIIALSIYPEERLQMDAYFTRCRDVERNFVSTVKDRRIILPLLNNQAPCMPIVSQIFIQ